MLAHAFVADTGPPIFGEIGGQRREGEGALRNPPRTPCEPAGTPGAPLTGVPTAAVAIAGTPGNAGTPTK